MRIHSSCSSSLSHPLYIRRRPFALVQTSSSTPLVNCPETDVQRFVSILKRDLNFPA
jgi:hypothetical protein